MSYLRTGALLVLGLLTVVSFTSADSLVKEYHKKRSVLTSAQGEILVRFKTDTQPFRKFRTRTDDVPRLLRKYRERHDVVFAEPNYIAHSFETPNDPMYVYQWHLDNPSGSGINTEEAWENTVGAGAIVAIVDTGIAYEDYQIRYRQAPDLAGTCFVPGYDFVNNDSHPNDDESHGTHVAGTVAQATNNGIGTAGIAHGACLMPVKVLNRSGSGSYSDIADGIRFAADNGANVINLSLGGPQSSNALREAVKYAFDKGVTIVAASGNDGSSLVSYPAKYDEHVIAVGATRYDTSRADYSNYGVSLDIVAPGGDLNVDQNGDGFGDGVLQQTFNPNNRNTRDFSYWFFQGTSMAAPHVAGAAALLISSGVADTPTEVREALYAGARDLGAPGWDVEYGHGLVDIAASLGYVAGPVDNPPVVSVISPTTGDTVSGSVSISATASDDISLDKVEFYIDEDLLDTLTSEPFTSVWHSIGEPDGNHVVTAVAYDSIGQSSSEQITVLLDNVNDDPIANAGVDREIYLGEVIEFDATGSYDPDGSILLYEWDFGDGESGSGESVLHEYGTTGAFTATLTVTDNRSGTASDTKVVTVIDRPTQPTIHVADITLNPTVRKYSSRSLCRVKATVSVVDGTNQPVSDARIHVKWSNAYNREESRVTRSAGTTTFTSRWISGCGMFIFEITNVERDGYLYDSSANVEETESVSL